MHPALNAVLLTFLAGAMIPLGGALATIQGYREEWLEQEIRHGVLAFGGGVLLAAVALVLVPDGMESSPVWAGSLALVAGGFSTMGIDIWLASRGTSASNMVATLSDFIPEAVALGAAVATGSSTALLLAILIGFQNLPEGFNSYREMVEAGGSKSEVLWMMAAASLFGPLAGLLGLYVLAGFPLVLGLMEMFAAGGILYLVFEDIAPEVRLEKYWMPPMGAVLGFLVGVVGHALVH